MTLSPRNAERTFETIVSAVGAGDRAGALSLAAAALEQGLEEPLVLLLAAERLQEQGRGLEALQLIERAAESAPEEAEVWRRLGGARMRLERWAEALDAFRTALEITPEIVPTLIEAGAASLRLGDVNAAEGYFRRAAERAPDDAEPLAALAVIAARRRKPAQARDYAGRALALCPGILPAQMARGRADLMENLPGAAVTRMNQVLGRADLNDDDRASALDLRAEALDAMDRPAEAFADYKARNAIIRRLNAPRIQAEIAERRVEQAERLARYFSAASAEPWKLGAAEDLIGARAARGHVFLLGFPRSGTTLLEKALAGHPDVMTLEEVDLLGRIGGPFLTDRGALDSLAAISPTRADAARETYWRGVREVIGEAARDKVVVDKLPLHTLALPVISKLFPGAKILFALRDPRDVVLSCFRRRFQINSAMFEFLEFEHAARYYDRTMRLATIYRGLLPLSIREVRHEAMVADFETEARRVLEFIGLGWNPRVARFAENARLDALTPSDNQLARGLNAEGLGQWRRYEKEMAAVSKVLEPWVAQFGYPATPATAAPDQARSWSLGFSLSQPSGFTRGRIR